MSDEPNGHRPRGDSPSSNKPHSSAVRIGSNSSNRWRRMRESFSSSPHHIRGSFLQTDLARAAIARDIEEDLLSGEGNLDSVDDDLEQQVHALHPVTSHDSQHGVHLLSASVGRPVPSVLSHQASMILGGADPTLEQPREEQEAVLQEERSLLRDNNLIPPKHPRETEGDGLAEQIGHFIHDHLPITIPGGEGKLPTTEDEPAQGDDQTTEETPLLGDPEQPYGGLSDEAIQKRWEEAVSAGEIHTTWQRETKTITKYSLPLILTFILQFTLTLSSVLAVGRIGVTELAAVSLAAMTANITGYAPFQGLGSSLDTLCAQAYGSGKKTLVGLQMLRGILFLWAICIPIAIIWLSAEAILVRIVPDAEVARLAGLYLKIILAGAPGWAAFECGKRYTQSQGKFNAGLYVLLVCAPLNAVMNYTFVWTLGLGYIGAPLAIAITDNLLPLGLFLYVRYVDGMEYWCGFTWKAFRNWGPMVKLGLSGLLMVESECLAFEIISLAASYFGTEVLAAQSVLSTIVTLAWQVPFPLSIAASTRVASFIGATLVDAAKASAKVSFVFAVIAGTINLVLLASLRNYIPLLFTDDPVVIDVVSNVLPLCAAFQLFDSLCAWSNGILRGLGRQEVGASVQVFAYYGVAMPISFGTGFGLGWGIMGLWFGCAVALLLVAVVEIIWLTKMNWGQSVEDAKTRNEADDS